MERFEQRKCARCGALYVEVIGAEGRGWCSVCESLSPRHVSRIARIAGRVSGQSVRQYGGPGVSSGSRQRETIPRPAWAWIADLVSRSAADSPDNVARPSPAVVAAYWSGYDEGRGG
ncbi:MAG: hypothetical protein GF393_04525 [Armatimonadia bacterium]|nr:hypothetical protein [Armatimonadia bacterium]